MVDEYSSVEIDKQKAANGVAGWQMTTDNFGPRYQQALSAINTAHGKQPWGSDEPGGEFKKSYTGESFVSDAVHTNTIKAAKDAGPNAKKALEINLQADIDQEATIKKVDPKFESAKGSGGSGGSSGSGGSGGSSGSGGSGGSSGSGGNGGSAGGGQAKAASLLAQAPNSPLPGKNEAFAIAAEEPHGKRKYDHGAQLFQAHVGKVDFEASVGHNEKPNFQSVFDKQFAAMSDQLASIQQQISALEQQLGISVPDASTLPQSSLPTVDTAPHTNMPTVQGASYVAEVGYAGPRSGSSAPPR